MHGPTHLVAFALLTLGTVSAHFLDNTVSPTSSFIPGKPTVLPEPKHALEPGHHYANPRNNPYHRRGAFKYGPIKPATNIRENFTLPEDTPNDQCQPQIRSFEERWAAAHHEIFYSRNRTTQLVGFTKEIFREAGKSEPSVLGEVTRSRVISYDCEKDKDRRWKGGKYHNLTSGHETREVFPPDTRAEIWNTWDFPRSMIGQVGSGCTGTLIGPRFVLTAGHCVHSGGSGGDWFANHDFTLVRRPGVDGKPFTKITFQASHALSPRGWTRSKNYDYDFAIVVLLEDTNEGWMSFGWHDGLDDSWRVNVDGFPGDKPADTMWHGFGPVWDDEDLLFFHEVDTKPGQSGSPVYLYRAATNFFRTYGVHSGPRSWEVPNWFDFWNTHTVTKNRATRINKQRFDQICGVMASPEVC